MVYFEFDVKIKKPGLYSSQLTLEYIEYIQKNIQ